MSTFSDINDVDTMDDGELFELLDYLDHKEKKENKEDSPIEPKDFCRTCNSNEHISSDYTQGIIVCIGCGNIISSNVYDEGAEWNNYGGDGKEGFVRCSTATNPFLPQSSLGTMIAGSSAYRLKTIQTWNFMPYRERALSIVLKDISYYCNKGKILKCIEDDAKILYKHISESKNKCGKQKALSNIRRGTNRKSIVAACIFYACKRNSKTRNPREIAEICELKHKTVTKGCKLFQELTKLKFIGDDTNISAAEHFIPRYCRILKIPNEYVGFCMTLANNIRRLNLASMHTPFSVATCSILLVSDKYKLGLDKKTISETFKISEVTIFKTLKQIDIYRDILINPTIVDKILEIMNTDRENLVIPQELQDLYDSYKDEQIIIPIIQNNEIVYDAKKFSLNNPNLNSYIDELTVDMYDKFGETEYQYKTFLEMFQ